VPEYKINAGAWYTRVSAEQLASCARRIDGPFTIEFFGESHRLGRHYVIETSDLGAAFQQAYVAFAADSREAELSLPAPNRLSLEWERLVDAPR
jgi:hypothetical protein